MKYHDYISIGGKIKEIRENEGKSQLELAKAIGKESSTYMALIEGAHRKVNIDDLKKIAAYFQKPVTYFLGEKEEKASIEIALRAEKQLNKKDKDQLVQFYRFLKNQKK